MSFATFGFAYVARPLGAIILGHFGDRIGRKKVLMFTLVLMGGSTFIIGCLPDFATAGWLAPVLLVLARLLQGLSAAGEQAGASSMTLEHAPENRRSYFTSWTLTGTQGGQILAALVFIPVVALPDDIKYSIGWRIPFWLSAVVVLVAFFIRRTLHEPPAFEEARKTAQISRLPVADLLSAHWRDVLRVDRLRLHRRREHRLRHAGHQIRPGRGPRGQHHHPLAGGGRQHRRAGHPAAVRKAGGPDRPQAGLHLRRTGQRGHDPAVPAQPGVRRRHR